MILQIVPEIQKKKGGEEFILYYIMEAPFIPGRSIQATATTIDGAEWIVKRIKGNV